MGKEKDDDNNLYIDWSEFEEAMIDLGVLMITTNDLKRIYSLIITKQNNSNKEELSIKQFMFELAKLKGVQSMQPHQILQQYFTPMITKITNIIIRKIIINI